MRPYLIEQKIYRQRRKRNIWKRNRNYVLNLLSKEDRLLQTANSFRYYREKIYLKVPSIFSFAVDIEQALGFIKKCKSLHLSSKKLLSFDFSQVTEVSAGALALLLSVINDLSDLHVPIEGNLPKNSKAKIEFIESGFLEFFYSKKGRIYSGSKNKILVQGKDKTEQKRTAIEIQKAMHTVFGISKFNTPLQGAIIEMMANSVNHAFPVMYEGQTYFFEQFVQNKRWYFSAFHDPVKKKVHFSFIDNGVGILKTIRRGIFRQIVDSMDDTQILQNAFNGEYRSSTNKNERGRGLPTIKDAFDKKAIRNLKIVTNDYLYSFDNQEGKKLTNSFEGTVYFWTLDEKCSHGNP